MQQFACYSISLPEEYSNICSYFKLWLKKYTSSKDFHFREWYLSCTIPIKNNKRRTLFNIATLNAYRIINWWFYYIVLKCVHSVSIINPFCRMYQLKALVAIAKLFQVATGYLTIFLILTDAIFTARLTINVILPMFSCASSTELLYYCAHGMPTQI